MKSSPYVGDVILLVRMQGKFNILIILSLLEVKGLRNVIRFSFGSGAERCKVHCVSVLLVNSISAA